MLKVIYFTSILCYILALFLAYRREVKIGISNVNATQHILRLLFSDLLLHKVHKASGNGGKPADFILFKKLILYLKHHNSQLFQR
jgi:hypothetical protein